MKIPEQAARPTPGLGRPNAPDASRRAASSAAGSTAGSTTTPASSADPAATVELSGRARELHDALRVAEAAPDVRTEVVDDVRRRLTDGRYEINAEATARRMIDRRA